MLKITTRFLVRLADRWMPDPLVVAIFLTFTCLLAAVLFTDFGVADSLPIWTFFSAGFLNLFIPSAGGQWAVQGPIAVEAAMQLGTDVPRVAMAVTLGESWTNAIQPLYAIPVLAVAALHIRDVVGYGVIICSLNGAIYLTGLLFF